MKSSVVIFILSYPFVINGDIFSTLVNLTQEPTKKASVPSSKKPALRYGFQKTEACNDFEKAFLCVRKCLDNNYDVAYSDKNCACTCYYKPHKAQYTHNPDGRTKTNWRLGAPTTSRPIWAQSTTDPKPTEAEPLSSEEQVNEDNANTNKPVECVNPSPAADVSNNTGATEDGNTTHVDSEPEGDTGDGVVHDAETEAGHEEEEAGEPPADGAEGAEAAPEEGSEAATEEGAEAAPEEGAEAASEEGAEAAPEEGAETAPEEEAEAPPEEAAEK